MGRNPTSDISLFQDDPAVEWDIKTPTLNFESKYFLCAFYLFRLEMTMSYLLDLEGSACQIMSL